MFRITLITVALFLGTLSLVKADETIDKYVTAAAKGEYGKVVSYVKKGVAIDGKNQARWTALAYACKYGHVDIVKFLIEKGANINETVNTGSSPLAVALLAGQYDIADYLVEQKADVNIPDLMGMSPLMWAVKEGNMKTTKYLLDHGAKINAKNNNGRSVLDIATAAEMKDFLKSKGAKTSLEMVKG